MAAIQINSQQFEQMIHGDKPVLVDFWAPWCVYCRRIAPLFDRIADEYDGRLIAAKINIDQEAHLADEEQIEIIPTLVLYQSGKVIDSIVAPQSKAPIDEMIKKVLGEGSV